MSNYMIIKGKFGTDWGTTSSGGAITLSKKIENLDEDLLTSATNMRDFVESYANMVYSSVASYDHYVGGNTAYVYEADSSKGGK